MLNGNGKVFIGDTEIDLDTQIELAEHALMCAQNHLDELQAQRDELINAQIDAQYEAHLDAEYGKACVESDADDKVITEVF